MDTTPTQPHRNSNTHRVKNNMTNVVIQQNSRKLLMMDILMSETCWEYKKWNKIASDIKLVFYSSNYCFFSFKSQAHFSLIDWLICDWVRDLTVPIHLGLIWRALCNPYRFVGALLLCYSSRRTPHLYSWCPLGPRRRSPDTHVRGKPKLHTHKQCRLRFHPLLHTSYVRDCLTALLGEDVSLGYYVQWEGQ